MISKFSLAIVGWASVSACRTVNPLASHTATLATAAEQTPASLGSSGTQPSGIRTPDFGGIDLLRNGQWPELARDIRSDAVDALSPAMIAPLAGVKLHVDFSTSTVNGGNSLYGIPVNVVAGNQAMSLVTAGSYAAESDVDKTTHQALVPIPAAPSIEGVAGVPSTVRGDQHLLIAVRNEETGHIDTLWEAGGTYSRDGGATWQVAALAAFDLASGSFRKDQWTTADAAGLPILPLLVRYDEVERGVIKHALRFTLDAYRTPPGANSPVPLIRNKYQWPARHTAYSGHPKVGLPFGARLRLTQAWYDAHNSEFSGQARIILEAMYRYGMILADVGGNLFFQGVSDERWDLPNLLSLQAIDGSAFEVVKIEPGYAIEGPTSGEVGVPVTFQVTRRPADDRAYAANIYGFENGVQCPPTLTCSIPMTPETPTGTFTYTPRTPGTKTLNFRTGGVEWVPPEDVTFTAQ